MSERDFSDSSVVNASLSNAEGAGSVSSWGDPTSWEDPTMCHRQKKAKHKKQRNNIVWGVCTFLSSVLSQQKFEVSDISVLQSSDRPVLQLHVTPQFYLESKGKYVLEA